MKKITVPLWVLMFCIVGCKENKVEIEKPNNDASILVRAFKNTGNWDSVYLYKDGHLRIIQKEQNSMRITFDPAGTFSYAPIRKQPKKKHKKKLKTYNVTPYMDYEQDNPESIRKVIEYAKAHTDTVWFDSSFNPIRSTHHNNRWFELNRPAKGTADIIVKSWKRSGDTIYPFLTESGLDTSWHTKTVPDTDTFGLRAIQDSIFRKKLDSLLLIHNKH